MDGEARPPILEQLSTLADGLRGRILLVLERQELTVSELCSILQLPQSTVSRHLKTLVDSGWIASRRDGTRRLYHMLNGKQSTGQRLWELAREPLRDTPTAAEDARRLDSVLAERRSRSQEFFAGAAADWDRLRDEMFGTRFSGMALLGLLDEEWIVADLGCGSGAVSESLAPFVGRVVAVDGSDAMLSAARRRLSRFDNVELRRGELESLPLDDGSVDAATLFLVLHHVPDPGEAIAEVARVLRPSGRLLIVDMLPHDRHEYRQQMGHVWLGFSRQQIRRRLGRAGLRVDRFHPLPPDPAAKGPSVFAATARKSGNES